MQIDNKKATYNIWLQKFFATVILTPLIIVSIFSRFFNEPFLGLDRMHWILIFCILYVSVILYHNIKKPYFVFYSDHKEKIVLRYYPIKAFNSKKNSIVIPKSKFVKYEIAGKGSGEKIILYAIFKNGIGKYPEVPLNALSTSDKTALYKSLNQYVKK